MTNPLATAKVLVMAMTTVVTGDTTTWGPGAALSAHVLRLMADVEQLRADRCYEAAEEKAAEVRIEMHALVRLQGGAA